MDEATSVPVTSPDERSQVAFWPHGWWRIVETRIGIVPVPVFPCATATSWVVVISEKSLAFNVTVSAAEDCAE